MWNTKGVNENMTIVPVCIVPLGTTLSISSINMFLRLYLLTVILCVYLFICLLHYYVFHRATNTLFRCSLCSVA